MSIYECDEEEIMQGIREDVFEQGAIKGRTDSILDLLNEYGVIPEELRQSILQESNLETLKRWHKLAAKVDSVEEFVAMKE